MQLLNPSLKLAPICPDGVQVFTDTTKVGKPYTEVAVLNSKGGSDVTSESGMINSQRKKAAGLGANGLILGSMKDPSTGEAPQMAGGADHAVACPITAQSEIAANQRLLFTPQLEAKLMQRAATAVARWSIWRG